MAQYLIRRALLSVLVLFLTTIITFTLAHSVPGDPVNAIVSEKVATPEIIAQVRKKYGLDKPAPVQYVLYLKNLLHGDLGQSLTTRHSVGRDLKQYFPATIELAIFAMFFAILIGGPLGVLAAIRHNGAVDHAARGVSLLGTAVPIYYLALLAQTVFAYRLKILPFGGRLDDGVAPPKHFTGSVYRGRARPWAVRYLRHGSQARPLAGHRARLVRDGYHRSDGALLVARCDEQ